MERLKNHYPVPLKAKELHFLVLSEGFPQVV
jgi:hypothetical protein